MNPKPYRPAPDPVAWAAMVYLAAHRALRQEHDPARQYALEREALDTLHALTARYGFQATEAGWSRAWAAIRHAQALGAGPVHDLECEEARVSPPPDGPDIDWGAEL